MEQIISKQEFDELMKIEWESRGITIKGTIDFVIKEEGKEGLKKLEDIITKFSYPIKYREIRPMSFYPIGLYAATLITIKRLFNYDNKKLREIGRFHAKIPIIIRIFMRYLVSLDTLVKAVPKMWRKYYTIGSLKVVEFKEEKRYAILRLENSRLHPFTCQTRMGYFSSILEMMVKNKVTCEETKCSFRGDEYHEFLLKW